MNIFNLFTITRYKKPNDRYAVIDEDVKLAKYIEKIRMKRGYSMTELAKLAGISKSTISEIESGSRKLTNKMAYKIGKALKVNLTKKRDGICLKNAS